MGLNSTLKDPCLRGQSVGVLVEADVVVVQHVLLELLVVNLAAALSLSLGSTEKYKIQFFNSRPRKSDFLFIFLYHR